MTQATPTTLAELIAYWDNPETHPYKGSLLNCDDYFAYTEEQASPPGLNCMCAQGQILTVLDQTELEDLYLYRQFDADERVAELLNISRTHAIVLRNVNDSVDGAPAAVLTDPAKILGPNADKIIDLWHAADAGLLDDAKDAFLKADYEEVIEPIVTAGNKLFGIMSSLQAAIDSAPEYELIRIATRELLLDQPGPACAFLDLTTIRARPDNYGPTL